MSAFVQPAAPSSGIDLAKHLGALLLVDVLGVEADIKTVHGLSSAISANVHVLDGPGAGESYQDALLFPKVLQSQLKKSIGQKVLGRLTQGVAKPGQDPPWLLGEASATDTAVAEAWVARSAPAVTSAAQPPF